MYTLHTPMNQVTFRASGDVRMWTEEGSKSSRDISKETFMYLIRFDDRTESYIFGTTSSCSAWSRGPSRSPHGVSGRQTKLPTTGKLLTCRGDDVILHSCVSFQQRNRNARKEEKRRERERSNFYALFIRQMMSMRSTWVRRCRRQHIRLIPISSNKRPRGSFPFSALMTSCCASA